MWLGFKYTNRQIRNVLYSVNDDLLVIMLIAILTVYEVYQAACDY